MLFLCDTSAPPAPSGGAFRCGTGTAELTPRAIVRPLTALRRRTERRSIMDELEEQQPADQPFHDARDCAEAIGQALATKLRAVPLEPLPAAQADLLAALRDRERSTILLRAPSTA